MTKKKLKNYQLFICLRPRIQEAEKAYLSVENIIRLNPGARVKLAGVGCDSHHMQLSLGITVPMSDEDPTAISGLGFANSIFESLYDYLPCYTTEPSQEEKAAAITFKQKMMEKAFAQIQLEDLYGNAESLGSKDGAQSSFASAVV